MCVHCFQCLLPIIWPRLVDCGSPLGLRRSLSPRLSRTGLSPSTLSLSLSHTLLYTHPCLHRQLSGAALGRSNRCEPVPGVVKLRWRSHLAYKWPNPSRPTHNNRFGAAHKHSRAAKSRSGDRKWNKKKRNHRPQGPSLPSAEAFRLRFARRVMLKCTLNPSLTSRGAARKQVAGITGPSLLLFYHT